jgi:hypothetical protein
MFQAIEMCVILLPWYAVSNLSLIYYVLPGRENTTFDLNYKCKVISSTELPISGFLDSDN